MTVACYANAGNGPPHVFDLYIFLRVQPYDNHNVTE